MSVTAGEIPGTYVIGISGPSGPPTQHQVDAGQLTGIEVSCSKGTVIWQPLRHPEAVGPA